MLLWCIVCFCCSVRWTRDNFPQFCCALLYCQPYSVMFYSILFGPMFLFYSVCSILFCSVWLCAIPLILFSSGLSLSALFCPIFPFYSLCSCFILPYFVLLFHVFYSFLLFLFCFGRMEYLPFTSTVKAHMNWAVTFFLILHEAEVSVSYKNPIPSFDCILFCKTNSFFV